MLRRPDRRYHGLKQATHRCLDVRAVLVNHMFEDRCCDNKEGRGEDDATVDLCELAGVPVRIEPPDEEDTHINLDVVFYGVQVRRLGFHEAHEDNGIDRMDEENGPEVRRRVQVPEVHH